MLQELNNKYPELREIAKDITKEVVTRINSKVVDVQSEMPYKYQWVLEQVIQNLEKLV